MRAVSTMLPAVAAFRAVQYLFGDVAMKLFHALVVSTIAVANIDTWQRPLKGYNFWGQVCLDVTMVFMIYDLVTNVRDFQYAFHHTLVILATVYAQSLDGAYTQMVVLAELQEISTVFLNWLYLKVQGAQRVVCRVLFVASYVTFRSVMTTWLVWRNEVTDPYLAVYMLLQWSLNAYWLVQILHKVREMCTTSA